MATRETERKLTAILSANVAGYSRLMGADEEATIETLTAYRKVFVSQIESHRGRVVDAKGDAVLAEPHDLPIVLPGPIHGALQLPESHETPWHEFFIRAGPGIHPFSVEPSPQGTDEPVEVGCLQLLESCFPQQIIVNGEELKR